MNEDITLLLGDCIELMKNIPEKSIDLILCDMPYGTTKNRWDTVLPLDKLWNEYKRISRGAIILAAQTPFDKLLGASNLPMLRYEWIWEKTHPTGHLNAKRAPMKAHENLLVFYDRQPTYNPIKTSGHKRISVTRCRNGGILLITECKIFHLWNMILLKDTQEALLRLQAINSVYPCTQRKNR